MRIFKKESLENANGSSVFLKGRLEKYTEAAYFKMQTEAAYFKKEDLKNIQRQRIFAKGTGR